MARVLGRQDVGEPALVAVECGAHDFVARALQVAGVCRVPGTPVCDAEIEVVSAGGVEAGAECCVLGNDALVEFYE